MCDLFVRRSTLRTIIILSLVSTVKLKLNGVRIYNVSLNIAFIFFTNVLTKRFKLSVSPRVLGCTRDFKLVVFMCTLKLRINPNFFDSFHGKKIALGVLTVTMIVLNAFLTIIYDCAAKISLPGVMNVLYNTAAGAPTLKTTRRALGRVKLRDDAPTLKYTITCPLKIVKIVLTILLVHGLLMHQRSLRMRRGSSTGGACVTTFRMRGPTVFGGDVGSVTRVDCPGFIVSHL